MKTTEILIKELEESAAEHMNEAQAIMQAAAVLKEKKAVVLSTPSFSENNQLPGQHPNYPLNSEDLLEKFRYVEDKIGKIWQKSEMETAIISIEGEKKAKKTFRSIYTRLCDMVDEKKLVRMRFMGSIKHTYFTTRQDWIEKTEEDGKPKYRIPEKYINLSKFIRLPEAAKNQDNIEWGGIDK